ncbi:MAG: sulfurtransferase-like selenium metabolism protein YedF [Firmicutes bacterium]|nr:sulfurtransferase-like selenium metabolism protein YedF [Bacillota bacterium]
MKQEHLDCRGLACPQPVVETKKRLATLATGTLNVLVDNETAKNNIVKLAKSLGIESMAKLEGDQYTIALLKEKEALLSSSSPGKTIIMASETLGHGSEELGAILMKSFFYALAESAELPQAVYLLNGGVKLACEGSSSLDSLQKLQALGVEFHSCGLCLDFFQLKEKLTVGEVTNMYAIVEQITAGAVIKL